MRGRRHLVHFQGFDVGGMLQDGAELLRELVDLAVGQFESRQARHMDYLVTGDAFGHRDQGYAEPQDNRVAAMTHRFLSPAWIDAVRRIGREPAGAAGDATDGTAGAAGTDGTAGGDGAAGAAGPGGPAGTAGAAGAADIEVRANLTVVDAPFETPTVRLHLDTGSGTPVFDEGHLDEADFMVEMPYALAYQMFVERDPAAVMPVLLGGQVKLTGDMSKLLALADAVLAGETAPPDGSVGAVGGSTARTMTA